MQSNDNVITLWEKKIIVSSLRIEWLIMYKNLKPLHIKIHCTNFCYFLLTSPWTGDLNLKNLNSHHPRMLCAIILSYIPFVLSHFRLRWAFLITICLLSIVVNFSHFLLPQVCSKERPLPTVVKQYGPLQSSLTSRGMFHMLGGNITFYQLKFFSANQNQLFFIRKCTGDKNILGHNYQ